ncbi:MAG: response regulator [Desulfobacterales bacterium]|nr:response regulator [Desulfobacterales bacterium]
MRRVNLPIFWMLVLVFLGGIAAPAPVIWADAGLDSDARILILNSYHPQYNWTDQIVRAITREFEDVLPRENIDIEYMDSRKREDAAYYERLYQLYELKYQSEETARDVIITTDDNAFDFLSKYRQELFPGVPVVFCGINFFDRVKDQPERWFTGIVESDAISENIRLIEKIHPQSERVVVIADTTKLGQSLSMVTRGLMDQSADIGPEVELWNQFSLDELYTRLGRLSSDTIVFLNILQTDKNGRYFSYTDDLPHLSRICPVPVYGQWGVELGYGIVGGVLNDAGRHGRNAAKLAKRILKGENPAEIPIQSAVYNPEFDHAQLKRFGIKKSQLPPDSRIINQPVSFYETHREVILATSAIIAGLVIVVLTLLVNIRRRRHSESALRVSEERYRRFFEEDLTADFIATPEGSLIDCNPAFARLFGFRSIIEAIQSRLPELFASPADYETCMTMLRGQGHIEGYEVELIGKKGTRIHVIANLSASRGGDGTLNQIKGYLFDITERKQLEQQLLQSQKLEALGRLAGGVAHDFNNLITTILGYSEIALLKLPESQEYRKNFELIFDAGSRAAKLTRQLLAFSRKQVMEFKTLAIEDIVKNLSAMLQSLVNENVSLRFDIDPSTRYIQADAGQLEQILLNLAVNANDAMPKGGTLTIEVRDIYLDASSVGMSQDMVPGVYVLLRVSDTGIGMTPEVRQHIFEPFFTTKDDGTGLGLSTIHGIVKQHKGYIFIYSEHGKGTAFNIYFPAVQAEAPEKDREVEASLAAGTETILVVEDDPSVSNLIKDSLAPLGYSVLTAFSGQQALDIGRTHSEPIDLLLTDVMMPGMNGRELAARFRELHPETPVVFMSGFSDQKAFDGDESMPDVDFISKPLVPSRLTARIREVLDRM